jgi:hypothetical protein
MASKGLGLMELTYGAGMGPGSKSQVTVTLMTAAVPPKINDCGCSGEFMLRVSEPFRLNPAAGRSWNNRLDGLPNTGDHDMDPTPDVVPGTQLLVVLLVAPGLVSSEGKNTYWLLPSSSMVKDLPTPSGPWKTCVFVVTHPAKLVASEALSEEVPKNVPVHP